MEYAVDQWFRLSPEGWVSIEGHDEPQQNGLNRQNISEGQARPRPSVVAYQPNAATGRLSGEDTAGLSSYSQRCNRTGAPVPLLS